MYNQVPLTAFLNRRAILAFFALNVGFILITCVLPFFALIKHRDSYEVSIQLTVALAFFILASLLGVKLMNCLGTKMITFMSLIFATGACFLLSQETLTQEDNRKIVVSSSEALEKMVNMIYLFSDTAIAGYLLICISIAFLTIASLQEILSGTENKLLRTKFSNASNLHLFVESAFTVYNVVQFAHVIGPILGGLINSEFVMKTTCVFMGWIGFGAIFVYLLFGIFVYCTVHHENALSLNINTESER